MLTIMLLVTFFKLTCLQSSYIFYVQNLKL